MARKIQYYDGTKILNMKDLEGLTPSIYLISSNRSAGKTSYFLKLSLEEFINQKRKVILMYRNQYELNGAYKIYDDVMNIYGDLNGDITTQAIAKGLFYELFYNDESMGFAISLNNPDALKKYSPLFTDVYNIIFDEFQLENGRYLTKEVEKMQSVLFTIARGGGSQSRYVRLFMLANNVTIMNPYYITFGIHKRLKSDTKFMRGNGWVAEFGFYESAAVAIKSNPLARAFENSDYVKYSAGNEYLVMTDSFIERPKGKSKYIFTILHDNVAYGVRDCFEAGIMYVSKKVDASCLNVITFKAKDHNQNTMMLNHYCYFWKNIKDAFQRGYLRFDDLQTKNAIFDILAIDIYK